MKKRVFWLISLSLLCMLVLAGCSCEPSNEGWYIQTFQKNTAYLNGVTQEVTYSGTPSAAEPFAGMLDGLVSIQFSKDGTVSFQPGTGETLTGTYTYRHYRLSRTEFTVTLDNGETFSGTARSYTYGSFLEFTFRDRVFGFTDTSGVPEELYSKYLQDLSLAIRHWVQTEYKDSPLEWCVITAGEEGYVLDRKDLKKRITLDETVAVECVRLDGQNNLIPMDAIALGECYCVVTEASENLSLTKITIYYVEPMQ